MTLRQDRSAVDQNIIHEELKDQSVISKDFLFGMFTVGYYAFDSDALLNAKEYLESKGFFEDFKNTYEFINQSCGPVQYSPSLGKLYTSGNFKGIGYMNIQLPEASLDFKAVIRKKGIQNISYAYLTLNITPKNFTNLETKISLFAPELDQVRIDKYGKLSCEKIDENKNQSYESISGEGIGVQFHAHTEDPLINAADTIKEDCNEFLINIFGYMISP